MTQNTYLSLFPFYKGLASDRVSVYMINAFLSLNHDLKLKLELVHVRQCTSKLCIALT